MSPEQILQEALSRYERPLIAYAKNITGEIESARDVVQETFLRLSRQSDLPSIVPRLAPWLFLVCRNCALDHRRKCIPFASADLDENFPDPQDGPDSIFFQNDDQERLSSLLKQLSQKQRELIQLKFHGQLSYKEIGEVTRMSVSNVGFQLHHAIQTLRTLWNQPPPRIHS